MSSSAPERTRTSALPVAYLVRPAEGGIKSHVLTLIKGLDRSRFKPVLICPPGTFKEAECKVIPLNLVGEIRPWRDLWTAIRLRMILRKVKPSILHIHSTKAGFVGRLALIMMRRRPKVILTVHSFVFDERVGKWRRRLVSWIERRLLRYTDCIVAVSRALRRELISEMGLRAASIQVIYNGIEFPASGGPKPEHAGIQIGTVARLAPQKGVDHFLRAAAIVKKRFAEAQFIVIGDGPNRYWLDTIVQQLGLKENVEFMGFRKDALQIVAGWDVFVLASTRESFGLALAEAMSQGVPVVASNVGGIPEIVDGKTTGLLAEVGDAEDFAEKICRLLKDRELAGRMARAGREFVRERFTAERMVNETQQLYELPMPNRRMGRMGPMRPMGLIGRIRQKRRMRRLRRRIEE